MEAFSRFGPLIRSQVPGPTLIPAETRYAKSTVVASK